MTKHQRETIRLLIDQKKREHIRQLIQKGIGCTGCGCDKQHEYTPGCQACYGRRRRARISANDTIDRSTARANRQCVGCGTSYYQYTEGCARCQERHRYRYGRKRVA